MALAISYDGSTLHRGHGFQVHVGPMRPTSHGTVRLRSADPRDPPLIRFNYLQTELDRQEMRESIRQAREEIGQKAFGPLPRPPAPGAEVASGGDIDAFVRAQAESAFHPSCTCAMGTGEGAVVDSECRVRDLESLRVVDASVMPSMISGNLNAAAIMLAERAADLIRGLEPLPASPVPVYQCEGLDRADAARED